MNLFEFLLSLGFWQWVGLILLTAVVADGVGDCIKRRQK